MKKSIIAAGAASVALAAMPIVGAFAEPVGNRVDTITATLDGGCTINDAAGAKNINISMIPGSVATSPAASSISITCNNDTWGITAVGNTTGDGKSANALYDGDAAIVSGTATSGNTSNWAFKIANLTGVVDMDTETSGIQGNAEIVTGYDTFTTVPATETAVVTSNAGANISVNTQYQIYTAATQAGGTYTGGVRYTVYEDISELD